MADEFINEISEKILSHTGIVLAKIQENTVRNFLDEKSREKNISIEQFVKSLKPDTEDFCELIKKVTINETYFFREEKQFEFLKESVFPGLFGKKVAIWSGACSTGEEAISLLALALECGIDATVYATDIDEGALSVLKNGTYTKNSFRTDGQKFHPILQKYGMEDGSGLFTFRKDFIQKIKVSKYNLASDFEMPSESAFDLIFLRNVFIYFDVKTRIEVLEKISDYIKPDGKLFFSMNEIGCIADNMISDSLYRSHFKTVYFFQKGEKQVKAEQKQSALSQKQDNKPVKNIEMPKAKKSSSKSIPKTVLVSDDGKPDVLLKKQLAEVNEKILQQIHLKDFDGAKKTAASLSSNIETKPFSYFFNGYIEYNSDNKNQAEIFFESSKILKPDFWPAFFYHGIVLKDMGKTEKANRSFDTCMKLLEKMQEKNPYDFILDSFSPSYIYSLCEKLKS